MRVVVLHASSAPTKPGDERRWVYAVRGQPELEVVWNSPRHLVVRQHWLGGDVIDRQASYWDGIQISYEDK